MTQKVNYQILLLSALLFSTPVQALIVLQQASIPVNVDYDSNLNLSEEKVGVWRYTSTPTFSVVAQDEKNIWTSDLSFSLQRSSDRNLSADREDPNAKLGWVRTFEKSQFSLNANYDRRSSRFAQFNNNALVDVDGTSVNRSLSANYSHTLTDRLNYSLGANYTTTAFTDSSFVDSTSKSVNASVNYAWNEKFSPFIQLSFTDFESDTPSSSQQLGNFNQFNAFNQSSTSKSFSIGSSVLISPRWTFVPSVGVNRVSTAGAGWIANTSLSYLAEKSTFVYTLARSVSPSGLGDFQETDTLSLSYSSELTDKSSWGTNFNFSKSQAQFDSEATQFSAFYARQLSVAWQMRLIAGYRSQKQDTFSANNNNFGISLIYNIPQF